MHEFEWYSAEHIIFIVVAFLSTFIAVLFGSRASKKADSAIRFICFAILILLEIGFVMVRIEQDENMAYMLPLELCTLSSYAMIYLLLDYSERLFKVVIYWITMGCLLSLLFPSLGEGPSSIRYWHYFVVHTITLVMAHYFFVREQLEVKYKDLLISMVVNFAIMLFIVVPINTLFQTDFMFLSARPSAVNHFFNWAGQYGTIVWILFIGIAYNGVYAYLSQLSKVRVVLLKNK